MAIAPELIASIAVKLISKWKADSSINTGLIPDKTDLISGLIQLINHKDLIIPDSDQARKTATDSLIGLAINAISKFQREIAPNLHEDGFLGKQTLNTLLTLIRCDEGELGQTGPNPIVDFAPSTEFRESVEILVYINGASLPRVTARDQQPRSSKSNVGDVKAAAIMWTRKCNIRFFFVDETASEAEKNKAHVWVYGEVLPNFNDLALADLWPSNGMLSSKLRLRFNTARTFVSQPSLGSPVFFGTAMHEFGHILGLSHTYPDGHTAGLGELMHPAHQPNLQEIPSQDADRIKKIWGEPA